MASIVINRRMFLIDGIILPPSQIKQFWAQVRKSPHADDCWTWQGERSKGGHGIFRAQYQSKGEAVVPRPAHRIAYMLSCLSKVPKGICVRHTCGLAPCCNPAHLTPGTARQNRQDYFRHRAMASRLTDDDRQIIKASRAGLAPLSKRFNVTNGIVWQIKFGRPGARHPRSSAAKVQQLAA